MEGIHAGIQTAHIVSELSVKYRHESKQHGAYQMWATGHKTIFVSNGGYASSLRDRYKKLHRLAERYALPCTDFHESPEALDGALTAVGIIVPAFLYMPSINRDIELSILLENCEKAR